jgi:hypothetical protein
MLLRNASTTDEILNQRFGLLFGGPDVSYAPVQFTNEVSSVGFNAFPTGSTIDLGNVFTMAHTPPMPTSTAPAFSFLPQM